MSLTRSKKQIIFAWCLIAPAVLIKALTAVYPFFRTFTYSFLDYSVLRRTRDFIGIGNFINIFTNDRVAVSSITFTLMYTAGSLCIHMIVGILLALLLNQKSKIRKLLRSITLIPWATPMVVAAMAASWWFNDRYGLVNDLLFRAFGIRPIWMADIALSRIAVILTDAWKGTPFFAIMLLAGLQNINEDLYEAARIDGSGSVKNFFYITFPLVRQTFITMSIFCTMWRMMSFDLIFAMTGGGPANATSVLGYRIYYEAFGSLKFGYSSALAMILILMMAVAAGIGFTIQRQTGKWND